MLERDNRIVFDEIMAANPVDFTAERISLEEAAQNPQVYAMLEAEKIALQRAAQSPRVQAMRAELRKTGYYDQKELVYVMGLFGLEAWHIDKIGPSHRVTPEGYGD